MQGMRSAAVVLLSEVNPSFGGSNERSGSSQSGTKARIAALDFTKGMLVLIMVLYHWLNYFVTGHDWIYKYLRFLPISFTFISGFLVAQVYLSGSRGEDLNISKRLLTRGLKLMIIAALLNLAPRLLHFSIFHLKTNGWSSGQFASDYFTGAHPISFSVLVPIAYVLVLSAVLFFCARYWRYTYHICCMVLVVCSVACEVRGIPAGHLPTVSIGMLGVSIGHVSIRAIDWVTGYSRSIFLTYFAYLAAIASFNDSYLLQVFGVCVTLLVIYWFGAREMESRAVGRVVILLGQYSLISYIIQIVILQVLRGSLRGFTPGVGMSSAAFAICIVGTIMSVMALNSGRRRAPAINSLYKAIFA